MFVYNFLEQFSNINLLCLCSWNWHQAQSLYVFRALCFFNYYIYRDASYGATEPASSELKEKKISEEGKLVKK
jgi:hypothetical protein